jgi:cell division protein FtsB
MRWVVLFLALTLAGLQLELWFGEDRLPGLRHLEQDVAAQSEWNQELAERNADLKAEILDLKQGSDAAEERARSELGLVLPTEDFYQFAR